MKVIEEVQARDAAHESRRPKEYPTGTTLFVDTASPQCYFCRLGHRIVELSLELRLVRRHSKGLVGATFALRRVMRHEIVVAESSV